MSTVIDIDRREVDPPSDVPRTIDPGLVRQDRIFHGVARTIGLTVLALFGAIGVFLGYQSIPTFSHYGLSFITENEWIPELDKVGIAAVLIGTVQVALVAIVVSFPLALLTALFITEFAPPKLRTTLTSLVDLMAAIPSIVYGLWGLLLLQPHAVHVGRWLSQNLGWIPFFDVDTDPNAALWAQSKFTSSAFIAGLAVAMMTIPLACAVMRGVFAQAPIGEREAAVALGATRWGVIRSVVVPFGKGGIIGGSMLGLGRALGEAIAVLMIISLSFEIKWSVVEAGSVTTSSLIAGLFGEATSLQLSALFTAGFMLFMLTLGVNMIAAIFIGRSRSGSLTEA